MSDQEDRVSEEVQDTDQPEGGETVETEPEKPSEPEPEPEKISEPEPEPEPEQPAEPEKEPDKPSESEPEPEQPSEPEPEPEPEQPAEPEPEPEQPSEPEPEPEPEKTSEPEPEPEKPSEPEPEPEPKSEEPAAAEPEKPKEEDVPPAITEVAAPAEPENETGDKKESEVKEKEEKVLVREVFRSTQPNMGVNIAMGKSGIESVAPTTVGNMLKESCKNFSERPGLAYKKDDNWVKVSFNEYYKNCIKAAKSFIKLGLERYNAVGIMGFNSPEWLYSNLGAMFAGGLSAGIYTTNGPEACHFVAQDCKVNIMVVEDQKQLDKILAIRDRLPSLKAIVQYKGKLSQEYENTYDWEQFMELGKEIEDSVVEEIIKSQRPEECALLIYTSGTTGNPKGVMLSHDNLTWTAQALFKAESDAISWTRGEPASVISYLPLSHIAGQMADIYLPMYVGATVFFANPDALKGSLIKTINEVKPTLFFGVPRVWEKIMEGMQTSAASVTGIKKKLGAWATAKGFEGTSNIPKKRPMPWGWTIANTLVLSKIRERLGLHETRVLHVGAAPVHRDVIEYFMKFNLPILELYGMSENTGPSTLNTIHDWKLGSVGKSMPGTHLKIDKPDENGDGEICMFGRHVFMGYLNNNGKTVETIDDDGWLHSGDIGRVDKDGFLYITGRIKELIITSGGENIAPVPIEDNIKAELPFVSNVMLIGDKRKFLSCLITLKCVMDPDTAEPRDELSPPISKQIADLGCELTKPSEIAKQKAEVVMKKIQEGLDKSNEKAVSRAQKVQKFTLLETDFSLPGGELGPTLKLKRRVVVNKYEAIIDGMYEDVPKL